MAEIITFFECQYCGNRYVKIPLIVDLIHCFGCGANRLSAMTFPGSGTIPDQPISSYFTADMPNSRYFYRDANWVKSWT